jgi:uncharacterized protein YbjT (DUF2867 family)
MSQESQTIVVFGATGQQGGKTVDALLSAGTWNVRAFTRNEESDAAKSLAARGVPVFQGDLAEPETLVPALEGAHGLFSVQVVTGPDSDEEEHRQGMAVVDAAKSAGVSSIVHSSAAGIERRSGEGGAKVAVEDYIRSSGISFTLLHPTSFMENFKRARQRIEQGTFSQALPGSVHQDYVAVSDIGRVAVEAFTRPDVFAGHMIELAGDRLTMVETAEVFSRVLGHSVEFSEMSRDRVPPYMASLLGFLEENDGYGVPTPETIKQRWGLQLLTLEDWLRREGWGAT